MNRKSLGQGMVEFALAVPIFLLLVLGVTEFGRMVAVTAAVYAAAREGARYGASADLSVANLHYYQDCFAIQAAASRAGQLAGLSSSPLSIQVGYDATSRQSLDFTSLALCDPFNPHVLVKNDRVVVRVSTFFQWLFLGLPGFSITAQTARTVVANEDLFIQPPAQANAKIQAMISFPFLIFPLLRTGRGAG